MEIYIKLWTQKVKKKQIHNLLLIITEEKGSHGHINISSSAINQCAGIAPKKCEMERSKSQLQLFCDSMRAVRTLYYPLDTTLNIRLDMQNFHNTFPYSSCLNSLLLIGQHTVNRQQAKSQLLGTNRICNNTFIIASIIRLDVHDEQPRSRYGKSSTVSYNIWAFCPSDIRCRHTTCRAFKTNIAANGSTFSDGGSIYTWSNYTITWWIMKWSENANIN